MPWANPNYWSVYRLTCATTGKSYIGFTKENVNKRWSQHRTKALGEKRDTALGRAIRKHGADSFSIETLARCWSLDQAIQAEINCIAAFNTQLPHGYNMTDGGEVQKNLTVEARKKMADAARGRPVSAETRAKWSAQRKGRKRPAEVSKRIGQTHRRLMADPEFRARATATAIKNLSNWNEAQRSDPARVAAREAKSAAKAAANLAREERSRHHAEKRTAWEAGREERKQVRIANLIKVHTGRKRPEETKRRLSIKAKARIGRVTKKNATGVPGVRFVKGKNVWRAQMTINYVPKYIGSFKTAEEAIAARRAYEALPEVQAAVQALRAAGAL